MKYIEPIITGIANGIAKLILIVFIVLTIKFAVWALALSLPAFADTRVADMNMDQLLIAVVFIWLVFWNMK